ncbi:MAG TPA: hypothetical protein VFU71_01305, partial [Burkholderiaceae bacterium]|nr:hypothetical protein [Burkholderiaceae bacterium]
VDEIEQVCEALAAGARFIRPVGLQEVPDEGFSAIYEFRHVLYREAVYRSLSEMNRVRLHRRIGERLKVLHALDRLEGAAEIAMHLQRAGQHEDAVRHLVMAAQNAARRFAYRGAIGILQDALELLKKVDPVRRAETECLILEQTGDIHYWLGDMSDSERAYRTQAALAAAAADRNAEIRALGRLLLPLGFIDPDRGVALAERAAALSTDIDAPSSSALAVMQAAAYRCVYDRWEEREWQRWTAAFELVQRSGQAHLPPYLESLHCYLLLVRGAHRDVLRRIEIQAPSATHQTPTPVLHLFTMSVKTVALMRAGRFGELLQLLRAEQELAARNGTDPWLCVLREAWLRTLLLDYEGACRLCERAVSGGTAYPTNQLRAIESVACGYRALDREQYLEAHECFARVCDLQATPKFFLHWLWRMNARAGLSETWLRAGDIEQARRHADDFLEAATSAADPHMHARAWDLQARIGVAEHDATAARNAIQKALAILGDHDVPTVAWQVHATAARVLGRGKAAGAAALSHRAHAVSCITELANTFAPDEPLRALFLSAAPVRQIVDSQQDAAPMPVA